MRQLRHFNVRDITLSDTSMFATAENAMIGRRPGQ
jgi:hypothetical protein